MNYPATVTLIAAVFQPPQRGQLTVSGTERIGGRQSFCNVSFFHQLNITQPEHHELRGGEVVHVTAGLVPDRFQYGRVHLHVTDLTVIGHTTGRNHHDTGYQTPFGFTLVTAEGVVASAPRTQTFGDGEPITNFVLQFPPTLGLLECSAYGLSAQGASQFRRGEQVRLQGRLLSRKRPSGNDRWQVYTKLELPRQQASHVKMTSTHTVTAVAQ